MAKDKARVPEYKITRFPVPNLDYWQAYINQWASHGWELVTIIPFSPTEWRAVFRR